MKIAVVLSGGGTKGAYEVGVIKAILSLGIKPNIITGTSIGALNGCLIAQQDYDQLFNLWNNIKMEHIISNGINLDFSIESLVNQSNRVLPFFKSYINHKGADITPLIELTKKLANEEKLKKSSIDFGLVCVEYPSLKPVEITKNKLTNNELYHYLLASSACFPAFPIYKFNSKSYIDGGYYDNLPIDLAFKMGADYIIAIELTPHKLTHPKYKKNSNVLFIRPLINLGNFLDFDQNIIQNRMIYGYFDTLKTFNKLYGFEYTFKKTNLTLNMDNFNRSIENMLFDYTNNILTTLMKNTYLDYLNVNQYSIIALEMTANMYQLPPEKLYTFKYLNDLILIQFNKDVLNYNFVYFKNISNLFDKLSKSTFKNRVYIILKLYAQNKKKYINTILKKYPKEFIIALYLYHLLFFEKSNL